MMWIIWALIIGFIVGGLARLIMPGRDPMGCFMTALLGIGGSILGGFIARMLWGSSGGGIRPGVVVGREELAAVDFRVSGLGVHRLIAAR